MAYNKGKEEKDWLLWKLDEETALRKHGICEEAIQKLREYDWSMFKSERRFLEWQVIGGEYLEEIVVAKSGCVAAVMEKVIQNAAELLDSVDNERLFAILKEADKLTVSVVLLRMYGFTAGEIAKRVHLTEKAVYRRMDRIKKKAEKIKNMV